MSLEKQRTLIELTDARYAAALGELEDLKTAPPMTPQQRFDRKKALAEGRSPVRQQKKISALQDELARECEMVIKGIRATYELVERMDIDDKIKVYILKQIGQLPEEE